MPRPRFEKLPATRRETILRAAAREFGVHGFHGASLNHILTAAGLSKGAAYYYFDDKADLFATVAEHYLEHLMRDADFVPERLTRRAFWPKVEELMRQTLEHSREWPEMLGAVKALWKLPRRDRESGPLQVLSRRARTTLRSMLTQGQKLGLVRTDLPDELLLGLVLALDEVGDAWLADHWDELGPAGVESLWHAQLEMLMRLLAPPPRQPRAPAARAGRRPRARRTP